jgi:putative FmdB family regulatory protein
MAKAHPRRRVGVESEPMPTYEYECDGCGHNFEEFQYFSEDPLTKCPSCKKKKLRRLFGTGASVIFKGSGFYETDYRSESYKAGAKAESEATKPPADAAKNGEAKAEAAPAKAAGGKGGTKAKAGKSGTGD